MPAELNASFLARRAGSEGDERKRLEAEETEERFLISDYDPGFLLASCLAYTLDCLVRAFRCDNGRACSRARCLVVPTRKWACLCTLLSGALTWTLWRSTWTTASNRDGTEGLRRLHLLAPVTAGFSSALLALLIKKRGAHARFVVAHYQAITSLFAVAIFLTAVVSQVISEQREPGTFRSARHIFTCLSLGYAHALPAIRLRWQSILVILAVDVAAVFLAGRGMGMCRADEHRTVAALVMGGLCAVQLSSTRLLQSRLHFEVSSCRVLRPWSCLLGIYV
jgi:hypothetical protein